MAERSLRMREVRGSIPCGSSFLHGCVEGDVLFLVSLFSGQSEFMRLPGDARGEHG
jgi:hypothetical protein